MVFYRKYRPQRISELDKEDIRNRLSVILKAGRSPHAFLFAGPKGTGKTSTARIVAKLINCENRGKDNEPCNKCRSCKDISRGNHVDIFEIDAASNRGIDEIRELREKINLSPASAKYKVYIIDEVHMLTREAFNALLKTLEEPPSHVVFILATTEEHKLPDTIISRCIKLSFTKATKEEIIRSLKRVVSAEKMPIKEEALEIIAKSADGSFRDAVKVLEQAAIEEKFNTLDIQKLVGLSGSFEDFLKFISEKKTKSALAFIQEKNEEGIDIKNLVEMILEDLHERLMLKYQGQNLNKTKDQKDEFEKEDLKKLIVLFSRAHQEMRTSYIESLPLELAVIQWGEKA